jgi:hypothetical protein
VSIDRRLAGLGLAFLTAACGGSDAAPSGPLPTLYQLDVRLAASCPAPVPAVISIPLTRNDDPAHAQRFSQVGRVTGTGTTVFEILLDGPSGATTGSFGGISAGTSDTGKTVWFSSAGARLSGSGTAAQGYTFSMTGPVSYCSEFTRPPGAVFDQCANSPTCDAVQAATLRPIS